MSYLLYEQKPNKAPDREAQIGLDAFQDMLPGNTCFGCGPANERGLRIKSYWDNDDSDVAVAQAYRDVGRQIGSAPVTYQSTGGRDLNYREPALLSQTASLRARVAEARDTKSRISCELCSGGTLCATSHIVAVRVPMEWNDV